MGSVYGQRELNTRPGGRKNNGGVRPGAGRPPFTPTKEQRRMVLILAGVGRPHKEIATLVINPRTGKPIDDANAAAAFPRRIVPLRQGEGRGQRRAWDAGTKPLGLGSVGRDHNGSSVPPANSDVLEENGKAKIIIELVKAPKRDDSER